MSPRDAKRLLRTAPTDVLDEVEREQWSITKTNNGHMRWEHPNGALVFSAGSPSDHRAWKNHLGELRRQRAKRALKEST